MATTDTSTLRAMAGVIGIGSLALFGATACDEGGTTTEEPVENGEMPQVDTMEEEPMEESPIEEETDS